MLRGGNYLVVCLRNFVCYYGKTYLITKNISKASMKTDVPLILN